jgi:YegS/Rv2252/BmrU family lipid kinase
VTEKISFIVNPNAGNGVVKKKWPKIKVKAEEQFSSFDEQLTKGPGDATILTQKAIASGSDLIVSVGGDGTLNEVINGFVDHDLSITKNIILGVIPCGTGCDFIKSLGLSKSVDKIFDLIAARQTRLIDLGKMEFIDHSGQKSTRFFHNVASFGLGGEVDERVNNTTKFFGGFITFIWATLISVLHYKKKTISLQLDEQPGLEFNTWNIALANGQYHGGGMWIAPQAMIDDGWFDITVLGDFTLLEVFMNLPKLYKGTHLKLEKVKTFRAKKISARSDQNVLLDVDGEQPGTLPITIEMVHQAIHIIAPI